MKRKETQSEGRSPRKVLQGLVVGAAAALIALALQLPGALSSFEEKTWDPRVRLLARPAPTTPQVALILLDQQSLDWGSKENGLSWPWPREVYTVVIDFCRRAGARALAFDVLFTEPSVYGVEDDARPRRGRGRLRPLRGRRLSRRAGERRALARRSPCPAAGGGGARPLGRLRAAGKAHVRAGCLPHSRARFRSARARERRLPAGRRRRLPARAALQHLRRQGRALARARRLPRGRGRSGKGRASGPALLEVDGRRIPIDREGRAILRFRFREGTHEAYSAAAVIRSEVQLRSGEKPQLDPELLRGRYVLFGYSAPGLKDLRASPVAGTCAGGRDQRHDARQHPRRPTSSRMRPCALAVALTLSLALAAGVAGRARVRRRAERRSSYALFLPLPGGPGDRRLPARHLAPAGRSGDRRDPHARERQPAELRHRRPAEALHQERVQAVPQPGGDRAAHRAPRAPEARRRTQRALDLLLRPAGLHGDLRRALARGAHGAAQRVPDGHDRHHPGRGRHHRQVRRRRHHRLLERADRAGRPRGAGRAGVAALPGEARRDEAGAQGAGGQGAASSASA